MTNLPAFELERYLAKHEFTARLPFSSSDCESMSLGDLLSLTHSSYSDFEKLWLGYTEPLGHPELRKAISTLYTKIKPEQILVHSGAEEAIFNFSSTFFAKEDHVIVHWPSYQSLHSVAQAAGAEITQWKADENSGWGLDLNWLSKSIKPNTKAVIVNFPHNPTGYLPSIQWYREFIEILRARQIFLFCDEVYRGLEYNMQDRLPAAADLYENSLSLGVMSKSYGLAGLRIGWVATQNSRVFQALESFKDYTTICNSAPSEYLATLAIQNREKLWQNNLNRILGNIKILDRIFIEHSNLINWVRPKAGCIAFPRFLGREGAEAFSEKLLDSTGVLLAPGKYFLYDNDHFRIGFGRKSFSEAIVLFASGLSGHL